MPVFTRRQLLLLALLTIIWGINWPIMKLGVAHFPPLSFRALTMWIGLAIVLVVVRIQGLPLAIPRAQWGALLILALFNMVLWHSLVIIALPMVSSGRAAILGYTMPIFSAIIGSLYYREALAKRAWYGVAAAFLGIVLLLWHEFSALESRPLGAILIIIAAACWALGTQMFRRTQIPLPILSLSAWMIGISAFTQSLGAIWFERTEWAIPNALVFSSLLFNGCLVVGFAQVIWFSMARSLPPVASTLSVMFIPVLGVFSGAWWLGETMFWQDWSAVCLMVLAIASVLWPASKAEKS